MTTSLHAPTLNLVVISIYMAAILLVGIILARRTVITVLSYNRLSLNDTTLLHMLPVFAAKGES